MIEIIPAINAESFEEVKKRIKMVEPYVDWVHIDVADGTFTPVSVWHNARDLAGFETSVNIEAHLMIFDMDRRIEEWLSSGSPNLKRIIFNIEASHDPFFVIEKCKNASFDAGISVIFDTSWDKVKPYINTVDFFQVLSVKPGPSGQKFNREALDLIRHLRNAKPGSSIEVDGGMSLEKREDLDGKSSIRAVVGAGADIIVAGAAIFGSSDVKKAIEDLKKGAN